MTTFNTKIICSSIIIKRYYKTSRALSTNTFSCTINPNTIIIVRYHISFFFSKIKRQEKIPHVTDDNNSSIRSMKYT